VAESPRAPYCILKNMYLFVLLVPGLEPSASPMLDKYCTTELQASPRCPLVTKGRPTSYPKEARRDDHSPLIHHSHLSKN
jgi:hypothetical protein